MIYEAAMDVDQTRLDAETPNLRLRALTSKQERRLIEYLDQRFLQFTRNFKKRSENSSTLPTLGLYLEEGRHILAFILQIPPVDPSTSLRIAYLLRLTADLLSGIPGYSLTKRVSDPLSPLSSDITSMATRESIRATLRDLLDFLDDLDQAWLAVLQGQAWDPSAAEGVDLAEALETITHSPQDGNDHSAQIPNDIKSTPPSQTELTRLRSLLVGGESAVEEWLLNEKVAKVDLGGGEDDLPGMLDRMGLLDDFDNLFTRTMDVLGFRDIKQSDIGAEVPMSAPFCT